MPYYERRTTSGRLMEIDRYYATRDGRRISRGPNTEESTDDQKRLNDVQAANRLRRIILANFAPEAGDLFVTLTMSAMTGKAEAEKAWRRFTGRLGRARARKGLGEAKWIKFPEEQSGRWHFHVVMNGGISLAEIQALWGSGRTHASVLDMSDNYRGLSRYLVKTEKPRKGETEGNAKGRREKFKRRWSCSKNLAKPEVVKRVISERTVKTMPKAPKGWRLLPEWRVGTDKFGNPFTHFECLKDGAAAEGKEKKQPKARGKAGGLSEGVRGPKPPAGRRAEPSDPE